METVLEPAIPAENDIHTEGEKLTGFAGLFWATSMERLSRARSFSITTTRYDGFFLAPNRAIRIISISFLL